MPALGGSDHHRAFFLQAERGQGLGFRLRQHVLFHRLPLAVEPVELGRDAAGLDRILLQQQVRPEIGAADAPAGIDARPEQEAEMERIGRTVEPRRIHQRGQPDIVAAAHRDQPFGDEGPVQPFQRHDIGDGAERDQVEREQADRARCARP